MTAVPNLKALLGGVYKPPSKLMRDGPTFSPEIAKLRRSETYRRSHLAGKLATKALRLLHPEDYQSLFAQAKEAIAEDAGPLPGDPGWDGKVRTRQPDSHPSRVTE